MPSKRGETGTAELHDAEARRQGESAENLRARRRANTAFEADKRQEHFTRRRGAAKRTLISRGVTYASMPTRRFPLGAWMERSAAPVARISIYKQFSALSKSSAPPRQSPAVTARDLSSQGGKFRERDHLVSTRAQLREHAPQRLDRTLAPLATFMQHDHRARTNVRQHVRRGDAGPRQVRVVRIDRAERAAMARSLDGLEHVGIVPARGRSQPAHR